MFYATGCNAACQGVIDSLEDENIQLQNTLEALETANNISKIESQNKQDNLEEMIEQCENNSAQLKTKIDELNEDIEGLHDDNEKLHNALVLILSRQTTRFNNSFYYVSKTTLGWYDAKSTCDSLGARLIEINDQAEHNFVVQLVKETIKQSVWVGGRYVKSEGVWVWDSSGDLIGGDAYTNWAPGQPAASSSTSCLQLWKQRGYRWDDYLCKEKTHFICEIWLDEPQGTDMFKV